MRRIFCHMDPLLVGHLEEVLRQRGIVCVVRNRYLAGAAGELPPTAIWPELLAADEDADLAERLVHEVLGDSAPPGEDWRCESCGEAIEGQFAACWKCGAPAPYQTEGQ